MNASLYFFYKCFIQYILTYHKDVPADISVDNFFKKSDGRVNLPSLFFCADSDENVQEEVTAMLAWAGTSSCIFEERRDNARTQFWHMSCPCGQR